MAAGCRDREEEIRKAKEDADVKARAEAARKEMEALPKAFQTPDYFKKNESDKKTPPTSEQKKSNP